MLLQLFTILIYLNFIMGDPIFTITIRENRWNNFIKRLNDTTDVIQNQHIKIDGTNGKNININEWIEKGLIKKDNRRGRGQLGCMDSHRRIYQYIVDNNLPYGIITEDDLLLSSSKHKQIFYQLMREFKNLNYDIAYLSFVHLNGGGEMVSEHFKTVDFSKSHLGHPHSWNAGMGYIVSLEACKKILKNIIPYTLPIDVYLAELIIKKIITGIEVFPYSLIIPYERIESDSSIV
jgi:GR25 family glycosyltransferase involved in LPS biosynthesis